mgnify:CR=1 FL=1
MKRKQQQKFDTVAWYLCDVCQPTGTQITDRVIWQGDQIERFRKVGWEITILCKMQTESVQS